jgi:hypothetical protein
MGHYYNEKVCPIYTPSISHGVLVGAGFLFWPKIQDFQFNMQTAKVGGQRMLSQ